METYLDLRSDLEWLIDMYEQSSSAAERIDLVGKGGKLLDKIIRDHIKPAAYCARSNAKFFYAPMRRLASRLYGIEHSYDSIGLIVGNQQPTNKCQYVAKWGQGYYGVDRS